MVGNGEKWLNMAKMAEKSWNWLDRARNSWNGWKWLEWIEMARNGGLLQGPHHREPGGIQDTIRQKDSVA